MKEEVALDESTLLSMFEDIPRNKQELDTYLRYFYDVYLASNPIEEGNSSPLDFAWDIFSTMMGLKPDPTLDDYNILGIAARGAQKSLTCAVVETLALTFDRWRDYFHMASIHEQSKVTYGYVQNLLLRPYVKNIANKSIMSETVSRFNRKLKVGTGTIRAVNSFHGSVFQDEVDLTDRRVFVESKGMLSPSLGKSPLNICISSRKFAFGNIQEMLNKKRDKQEKYPLKIHQWGQLEITQRCDDVRSGGPGPILYVDEEDLVDITEEQYNRLPKDEKIKFVPHQSYKNCHECKLFSFCLGKLKNQTTDNPFLQNIDDVRRLFLTDDVDFFKAQRLNRKPSRSGLVYPMFEPSIHCLTYEKMYEVFMGEAYEGDFDLTFDAMVELFKKHHCGCYVGLDFGFNMAVALLAFVDGKDNIYILDEVVCEFKSDAEFELAVYEKWGSVGVDRLFPDIENPGGIKEFKKHFNVVDTEHPPYATISKKVNWGLGLVRKHLRVPGSRKQSKLFFHNSCEELGAEIELYRLKIDPELDEPTDQIRKKKDHACDAMRYLCVGILGMVKVGYIYVEDTKESAISTIASDNNMPPPSLRAPLPEELALFIGRTDFVDNRNDYEVKDGKVVQKPNISGSKVRFTLT